ncbi:hypothetical protein AVEN_43162-1 [Araneus ventricosus]|uniref:Uncharacterized protein n=1 Tax=Araneus ventricosus TaxID=182803 RepID=A0A4Y2MWA6_ARAVE|nr:hypothetical protein AVEN_43162-1 [Araneus ventricosus]
MPALAQGQSSEEGNRCKIPETVGQSSEQRNQCKILETVGQSSERKNQCKIPETVGQSSEEESRGKLHKTLDEEIEEDMLFALADRENCSSTDRRVKVSTIFYKIFMSIGELPSKVIHSFSPTCMFYCCVIVALTP